jgi:hypothetical protein
MDITVGIGDFLTGKVIQGHLDTLRNKVLFRHIFPIFQNTNSQIIFMEVLFICIQIMKHVTSRETELSIRNQLQTQCRLLPAFREI